MGGVGCFGWERWEFLGWRRNILEGGGGMKEGSCRVTSGGCFGWEGGFGMKKKYFEWVERCTEIG